MGTYRNFAQSALQDKITGQTLKALLVKSTYAFDQNAHVYLSDVNATGTEVTAAGYSRQTLTSVSVTYDPDVGVILMADDIDFGTFTQAGVLGPIFYIDTGTASTSELISGDVDNDPFDVTNAVATIYRIDASQGFLLAQL